jgi:hypothetical protein
MNTRIIAVTLFALGSCLAACGGATPAPAEVSEERAEDAKDVTDENNDRADTAADKAEDNAVESGESADGAEKAADETK